jgi:hypothetical protein
MQATKMPTIAQATQVERLPMVSPPSLVVLERRSASWARFYRGTVLRALRTT